MQVIINHSSMVPIYEQLVEQIKKQICSGELSEASPLPSVRVLAGEQKISALTVKKAYDSLEEAGFVTTIHGKGTFVARVNPELAKEEQLREVEAVFAEGVRKGRNYQLSCGELEAAFRRALGS